MTDPIDRRTLLTAGTAGLLGMAAGLTGCAARPRPSDPSTGGGIPDLSTGPAATPAASPRVLLAYFSRAGENYFYGGRRNLQIGNTAVLAGMITDRVTCQTYRIEAAEPYPDAYDPTVQRNVQEQRVDARPAIASPLPDITGYQVVLLGSPVWNVRAPMIMSTFVEGVDLAGRMILPFVTYAVSGMAGVDDRYRRALPVSDVRDGLAVQGETVTQAGSALDDWLAVNGLQ
jgi:flavodoxin